MFLCLVSVEMKWLLPPPAVVVVAVVVVVVVVVRTFCPAVEEPEGH